MIEEYGWPDNFKSEEWKRDRKRITKEILEHQRKLDEEEIARRKSELEDSNILSEFERTSDESISSILMIFRRFMRSAMKHARGQIRNPSVASCYLVLREAQRI